VQEKCQPHSNKEEIRLENIVPEGLHEDDIEVLKEAEK
jgi:hypothetical protein